MTPTGAKRWVFRFRLHGKRPETALGFSPDMSPKYAREFRDEARQRVAEGIDPRDIKHARKKSA
ncbi:hypothetical protein Misp06_01598 [Microbulbifer sp. NBRC 101763]|uniref:Arm DNA-binding domain-containing protein n=1 Tax=unclassified Microbulbifer TaxID=2619833 RepID=UPI0030AFDE4C